MLIELLVQQLQLWFKVNLSSDGNIPVPLEKVQVVKTIYNNLCVVKLRHGVIEEKNYQEAKCFSFFLLIDESSRVANWYHMECNQKLQNPF